MCIVYIINFIYLLCYDKCKVIHFTPVVGCRVQTSSPLLMFLEWVSFFPDITVIGCLGLPTSCLGSLKHWPLPVYNMHELRVI